MKPTPLAMALSAAIMLPASGANIVWISFHAADDAPSAAAAAAGFTMAPDIGYTDLLAGAGHTVNRQLTQGEPGAAQADIYNAADLVIISRSVPSGNFDSATEAAFWNETVTTPVMLMSGYILRSNRLNYTSGTDMPDTTGTTTLSTTNTSHPVFSGISFTGDTMDASFASLVVSADVTEPTLQAQRGISVNNNPIVGGTILGTGASGGDPTDGGTFIAEWSTGAVLNNGNTLAGPRMAFLSGSREASGLTSEAAGIIDLSAEGSQIFLNAVDYMAIPEPSALAFVLAGGMLVAVRRRR